MITFYSPFLNFYFWSHKSKYFYIGKAGHVELPGKREIHRSMDKKSF